MTDLYRTIKHPSEGLYKEKGSKFLAYAYPVSTEEEIRQKITDLRKQFHDARHHCYAWRLGPEKDHFRVNDDGEPSGTAGKPALAVLCGSDLGDVALVVTRYFGGTKLGTGGLVRAYTQAAQAVVSAVPRAHKVKVHITLLAAPYPLLEQIRLLVEARGGAILDEEFAADVTMTLRFPVDLFIDFQAGLKELSAGKIQAEVMETKEVLL